MMTNFNKERYAINYKRSGRYYTNIIECYHNEDEKAALLIFVKSVAPFTYSKIANMKFKNINTLIDRLEKDTNIKIRHIYKIDRVIYECLKEVFNND